LSSQPEPAAQLTVGPVIERLAAIYTTSPWITEMERARQEYDAARGRVYDDDELFEAHIAGFLEWYVLERPLPDGQPPVVVALREAGVAEERQLRALALSYRSVFEVVDTFAGELLLSDLVSDGLWRVDQDPPLDGIDPGDIFEARLIPWASRVVFGQAFCFHPRQARESIHALLHAAELERKLRPEIVFALAEMRLRQSRFRNIAVEKIYTLGSAKVDARPGGTPAPNR
jgi:hypothetical protein